MHLPAKIKTRYIAVVLSILLFIIVLPLRDFFENFLLSFSRSLFVGPHTQSQKIKSLEMSNLYFSLKLRQLQYLKDENEKLRSALQFMQERKISFTGADIIAFDPSNWRRSLIVNVGRVNRILAGLYAIDENGYLVGKVADAKGNYSRIVLVNDADFSLPVFIGDHSFGLLRGALEGVKILYIENGENISPGDKVWFKIPSVAFPIYIGEITSVKKNAQSLFWEIGVKLYSQNVMLRKIFIVK